MVPTDTRSATLDTAALHYECSYFLYHLVEESLAIILHVEGAQLLDIIRTSSSLPRCLPYQHCRCLVDVYEN